MKRIEPTIGTTSEVADPVAAERGRAASKSRRLCKSLLGWLSILFVLLAIVVAGAGYSVHSGILPYASEVGRPEFIYPLAGFCAFAALAVTYGGWFGFGVSALASAAIAAYLVLYSPRLGGGFYFIAFTIFVECYAFVIWRRGTQLINQADRTVPSV